MIKYAITQELLDLIAKHEGWREKAYDDATGKEVKAPQGKLTIGYGFNIQDMGIPEDVADFWLKSMLEHDYLPVLRGFFPKFGSMSKNRQYALISMIYNLGASRFSGFKQMIAAINAEDWQKAAEQALASKWASQVKNRAVEISHSLLKG